MALKLKKLIKGLLVLFLVFIGLSMLKLFRNEREIKYTNKYNSKTAYKDIERGAVKIVVFGLIADPTLREEVAKKYGFHYDYLGCSMTEEIIKGVNEYNSVMEKQLTNKFGENFWDKFNAEVDSLSKTEEYKNKLKVEFGEDSNSLLPDDSIRNNN
jgi:hypothetical protein